MSILDSFQRSLLVCLVALSAALRHSSPWMLVGVSRWLRWLLLSNIPGGSRS